MTLSINLTSSSRRKGPVCPGTMPDSWRVRRRAHTPRHHYLPVFLAVRPSGTCRAPRRPLGNTLPLVQPFHLLFHEPSATRSCARATDAAIVRTLLIASLTSISLHSPPFVPARTHRRHPPSRPLPTIPYIFRSKEKNSPPKLLARVPNRMGNLTIASDTYEHACTRGCVFPQVVEGQSFSLFLSLSSASKSFSHAK